jgi:hypothetical protein
MCVTLASQSGLFADTHMLMNPLGMDSRSLLGCGACRRQLAHCSQSVEDITTTSPLLTLRVTKTLMRHQRLPIQQ